MLGRLVRTQLPLFTKQGLRPLSLVADVSVQESSRTAASRGAPKARLIEIFSAIQGEGLIVGTRQIFVRFAICDLRCRYCDSSHTWKTTASCSIEKAPGSREFETHQNPIDQDALVRWIERQHTPKTLHDSISLTGGEPLLHAKFLVDFLPKLRKTVDLPVYLESAGHRPDLLDHVLPFIDMIGMDVKLPSVSGESHWKAHSTFLKMCLQAKKTTFVKMIISKGTAIEDLTTAAHMIRDIDPQVHTYLQPVSKLNVVLPSDQMTSKPVSDADVSPDPGQVLSWQQHMKSLGLKNVLVVPQTHKFINQM